MSRSVRVRFAPAPTGMMHLGNIRQALINLIFARQHQGVCILRIEDTDQQRMFDPSGSQIRADLAWLGITFDEGPDIGGSYGPYIQSQRTEIYQQHLHQLIDRNLVYRCFCTTEELEKQRQRQIMLHQPPRYPRTCRNLPQAHIEQNIAEKKPFIWRFKLNAEQVTIHELVRGPITFDLNNFADFPLTRQDGSFTFLFANAIDDITMKISHVFRGEDHLSNTANQAMIYQAFNAPLPIFWHTPIICNRDGKKLSKRDFGFSLDDLRTGGFLPEAIINYLACIGSSIEGSEILPLDALIARINFAEHSTSSSIKYDVDKLRWMNHAWMKRLPVQEIAHRCRTFLEAEYPAARAMSDHELAMLIEIIHTELTTLADSIQALHCYFHVPEINPHDPIFIELASLKPVIEDIFMNLSPKLSIDDNLKMVQERITAHRADRKQTYKFIRLALSGASEGTSISNLFKLLPMTEIITRLKRIYHS